MISEAPVRETLVKTLTWNPVKDIAKILNNMNWDWIRFNKLLKQRLEVSEMEWKMHFMDVIFLQIIFGGYEIVVLWWWQIVVIFGRDFGVD